MTDFLNALKQAQVDRNVSEKTPGVTTLTEDQIAQSQKEQIDQPIPTPNSNLTPEGQMEQDNAEGQPQGTPEEIAREQTRMERAPITGDLKEPQQENPYLWTPEYTQRGFVEEVGTSLMRGFGKHVVGGTGDILQLVNGLVPGWEIREGNQLSRGLQEQGAEFERDYKVFMPDELKDNEFTLATFTNPQFWSKTAAEYIPQLVEMIILSKGAGGVAKKAAQSSVKGLTKGMTRESLEALGSKVVGNTSRQLAGGAAQTAKVAGQGAKKGWRALFMDTTGEATAGFVDGAGNFGGGLGMNLLAGLQNAGGLVNEMKNLKDPDTGEPLYTEEQLSDMASSTMIENLKYLPIDMLSFGMTYAKSTGRFNKMLNPFNKKGTKKFYNSAEQIKASSKSFTREITPLMRVLDATGNKLAKTGKRLKNTASAVSKPLFEGFEETFQETFEDWAKKKAVAKVTGKPITIDGKDSDGSMASYFDFYLSKENEATRTIAMALGMLGGAGSNIVEAVNKKAETAYKNYSKTELLKRAASNEKEFNYQAAYIKEQLTDNVMDGYVDNKAWLEALAEEEVISEDMKEEYIAIAKNMELESVKATGFGLNDIGKEAYLNHKYRQQVAKNGLARETQKKNDKVKALKEEYQGKEDSKEFKSKLKNIEESWETVENGFATDLAFAEKSILSILSGEQGEVSNIKYVDNAEGNRVAVGLSAEEYDNYYNKTNEEIYKDAKTKKYDPKGMFGKMGKGFKDLFNSTKEKVKGFKEKTEEKVTEIRAERLDYLSPEQKIDYEKKSIALKTIQDELATMEVGKDGVTKKEYDLKKAEATSIEVEMADMIEESKKNVKNTKGGRAYMDEEATTEEEEEFKEESAPERKATPVDEAINKSFTKPSDTNVVEGELEMIAQLEAAKIDFKDKVAAERAIKRLISTAGGRIEQVANQDGVTEEQMIAYLMGLGSEGSFRPESKVEKEARLDRNKKGKDSDTKKKARKRKQPTALNERQSDLSKKFNDPNFQKEYRKIVKKDPTQKKVLQEEYDEYLSSLQAEMELGPSVITQQVAVNQHLRQLYPDSKIQAYAMKNMYESLGGVKALGYAALSAIMIDEKVWNQSPIFMHEFAHIHYSLSKNDPATIAVLKEALRNDKLKAEIEARYRPQTVFIFKQEGWKPGMKKKRAMWNDLSEKQQAALTRQLGQKHKNGRPEAYKADWSQQPVLLDELFAHYMQDPMTNGMTKFFTPIKESARQQTAKSWWQRIKGKAKAIEKNNINVVTALNEGETVDPTNLNNHIMGNFVNMVQGKEVTVGGRFAMDDVNTEFIKEDNNDVYDRIKEEKAVNDGKIIKNFVEPLKVDSDKIGKAQDDFDIFDSDNVTVEGESEYSAVEFAEKLQQDAEMDLGTMWDDQYNATNMKTTEVIRHFVEKFNQVANQTKSDELELLKKDPNAKRVDAMYTEGINLNKLTEGLMDLAAMYESPIDFIRVLEQSKKNEHKAFIRHLKKEFKDPLSRLTTMHLLYNNSVVLAGIIHTVDKDGKYSTVTPMSANDPLIIERTVKRTNKKTVENRIAIENAILEIAEAEIPTPAVIEAIETVIKFYAHDLNIAKKILANGHLIVDKKNVPLKTAIIQLVSQQEMVPYTGNSKVDSFMDAGSTRTVSNYTNTRSLIASILHTGKKYGSTSVVKGPTGNNVTTRMFSNHSIKLFNRMMIDLKNSENSPKAKKEFVTKYSNSPKKVKKAWFNPILESFYDNYHTKDELPLMVLDFGSKNDMYKKAKNYKDASAEQQLMNEMLQFTESQDETNPNYLGSMDILGNSSRRILLALPRIENLIDKNGKFNTNAVNHLNKMYSIYEQMSYDKKKFMEGKDQKRHANFDQFQEGVETDIKKWEDTLTKNSATLSKVQNLTKYFKVKDGVVLSELSDEGKAMVRNFVFNRIANTFYVHQMMSPGLLLDSITKSNKGQIAPVIALDPNLRVEMIPMDDEFKLPRPLKEDGETESSFRKRISTWEKNVIVTNDGIQYILEEHAEAIQHSNPDFNKGYKLYSHSIEKDNPWFMNQSSQMKGYTAILTEESVRTGNQQHLFPVWEILNNRNKKFKADYKAKYGEDYDPNFRTQTVVDASRPKYIPIATPITAEKAGLFHTKELLALKTQFSLKQLQDPATMKRYEALLDKLYYTQNGFVGLDGSNFGPQQIMDKRYTQATFGTQVLTSLPHGKSGSELANALEIQEYMSEQKWINFRTKVLDEMAGLEIDDDFKYSTFIKNTANKLNSDPYTIAALTYGELPYSPHVAEFAGNQFRSQIIRHGNNLKGPGTYGQTISDMGYKYVDDNNEEVFVKKPNRDKVYPAVGQEVNKDGVVKRVDNPKVSQEYVNGSSGLNFYGVEIVDGIPRTKPMEIVLPRPEKGDKTQARESFYSKDGNGGKTKARAYLTATNKRGAYIRINTLKRLNLITDDGILKTRAIDKMLTDNAIYSSPESTPETRTGTYIPGETVMMTRIPHNGPAFVGVAEVVGFHDTGASNIIVPSEYTWIIGADHDGDALFVYQQAKMKDGSKDTRMKDGYGNWNKGFDMMVDQWLSNNQRITLETPLRFESNMDSIIEENNEALHPEQYAEQRALESKLDKKQITQTQFDEALAKIRAKAPFTIPFGTQHYTEQYNNSVIAKQTIGIAFNSHRALNLLATYNTRLANGTQIGVDASGKTIEVPKLVNIAIDGQRENGFDDVSKEKPLSKNKGINSRVHLSTILANIVLDSTKNGHADALNLNINSISSAMILVNLGFDIKQIGLLFNHPMAAEYISKRNDIGNDYIDTGGYGSMIYQYKEDYPKLDIYSSPNEFDVTVDPQGARYESEENNMAVLRLMHYLSKVGNDISKITNITSGHNKLEMNPFALQKQVNDLNKLITNQQRESSTMGKEVGNKNATLYFKEQKDLPANDQNIPLITDSPELKHYKRMALEFNKHQKHLNIIENDSIRDIVQMVANKITASELNGTQLKHYSDYLIPFIYGRLLGVNDISTDDINDIFQDEQEFETGEDALLPLATELREYGERLDETVHYENPNNVMDKDTDYTRSRLFNQGIIIQTGKVKLNPQVLQRHYTHADRVLLQDEFAELPLHIQKKLVLYDLIQNGWTGEESLYPIFPPDITSYITARAKKFKENNEEISDKIIKDAFGAIQDLETNSANIGESNHLPSVFLDNPLPRGEDPASKENDELYTKLGYNKTVINRIHSRIPFRVTVHYPVNGQRVSEVIEIQPVGPYITKDDDINERTISNARSKNQWSSIARDLITSKTSKGHVLFKKPSLDNLQAVTPNVPQKVHMVLIKDDSTTDNGNSRPLILDNTAVMKDKAKRDIEASKKKNNVGRYFKDDYYNYTREEGLDQQELIDAYEYKQSLTYIQEARIWLNYRKDKARSNAFLEKYKEGEFKKELIDTSTENLLKLYNTWGKMDAYATANVMVPVMLELTQRASNEQSELTGRKEGQNDIGVVKAWFQTNNIDSSHPATQAVQRELETEFKGFMTERKKYLTRINDVSEALYAEKFNYNPAKNGFIKKLQRAAVLLFKNRDDIYRILYGNLIKTEYRKVGNTQQKRYALLPDAELRLKLANKEISENEYKFAKEFRDITNELDPKINDPKYVGGGIPSIGMGRLESFGRKGMLGMLMQSRPLNESIGDVELMFEGKSTRFKDIENIFRQEKQSSWKTNKEYVQLRRKAVKLFKTKKNEDGSNFKHEDVFNHTILGDGMVNNFANGGWINADHMASLDLNKALSDFTHTQLFITGNKNFQGFKALQAVVDGLFLHNKMKGFTNQNKFVRKVYKEYFLKAKKLTPNTTGDNVMDAMVRGNLLYIMGWKLLAVHKGMYTIGNVVIGKYNNIKNQGGKSWLAGEGRFWGKHKKAMGILKAVNFTDSNFYDDVNLQSSSGLDSIFTDIALWPMMASEQWIQGVHFLGMLTSEQYNRFDDNGNYKSGATEITPQEVTKLENEVKNSHGKGYTPTDQRLIQRYSWGRAIMQFSRFIPTMVYDKLGKEDVNIYGEKHIGSLTAVWEMIAKFTGGEIPIGQLGAYRAGLEPQIRARFDAGLKGLAMVSVAIIAGQSLNANVANELVGDANYLVNTSKLEFKAMPSALRTIVNMLKSFAPSTAPITGD